MADYDYALSLDAYNAVASFNRGLLFGEVQRNDSPSRISTRADPPTRRLTARSKQAAMI